MLDPYSFSGDPRPIAEIVKDYPPCWKCGQPFGNAYFGAGHYCTAVEPYAACGHVPDPWSAYEPKQFTRG